MKYISIIFLLLLLWTLIISLGIIGRGNEGEELKEQENILSEMKGINEKGIAEEDDYILNSDSKSLSLNDLKKEDGDILIMVYNVNTKEATEMKLEEYIIGVVYSEMPASFETEALKAQAVAARSFCIYKILNNNEQSRNTHNGADVCNDYAHCKAYMSYEEACEKFGEDSVKANWEKMINVVNSTRGEIITYEKEPAVAVFHAISDTYTESAEDVWGGEVPYLVSVPTPEDESVRNFISEVKLISKDFKSTLTKNSFKGKFPDNPSEWIGETTHTDSGRVEYVNICGTNMTGLWFRTIFNLRSTSFTIKYDKETDEFTITAKGYGHGVGMSQYGANLMALDGKGYREILCWYYTGIEITELFYEG